MKKGVSVVICCYNSSQRLQQTLEHLAKQEVSSDTLWEVIIADNNSTDNTGNIAESIWEKLKNPIPIKITLATQQGISFAREAGIAAATYEYILFCDDDNWLNKQYVQKVFNIFEQETTVASIGGVGEAVCEIPPPQWFEKLKGECYACSKLYDYSGRIKNKSGVVYGAGMAIRKSIFIKLLTAGFSFSLKGRNGNQLSMGEEIEMGLFFRILGYDIWYDNTLTFKHFITKNRLSWSYFENLRYNYSIALTTLYPYYHTLFNKPSNSTFYILWFLKTLFLNPILHTKKYLLGTFLERQLALRDFTASKSVLMWSSNRYLKKRQEIEQIKKKYHEL